MDERHTSATYRRLSGLCRDRSLSKKLLEIGNEESEHADFWTKFLKIRNIDISHLRINTQKIFFLSIIFKLLGIGLTLKILEIGEHNAIKQYSMMIKNPKISEDEKKGIIKILKDELNHEEEFEEYLSKFKFFINRVNMIFSQMSNGLVTVLSLSVGIAGIYDEPIPIAVTGLIIGLSGSLSTILTFYLSSSTQKRVRVGVLSRIKIAAMSAPQIFVKRVNKYMKKKDISEETARIIANEASEKIDLLTRIVAEEEYGIKEEALGNPLKTALYAGVIRIIGTILPLIPYFLNQPIPIAIPFSILITVLLLVITGSIVALSAELDIKKKIIELTISGLVLATATFIIGKTAATLKDILILSS